MKNNIYQQWWPSPSDEESSRVSRLQPLLTWWFKLTAPPPSAPEASFLEREKNRQGRLTSAVLFYILLLVIVALPVPLIVHNWILFVSLLVVTICQISALALNRRKRIVEAGLVSVGSTDIGIILATLTVGHLAVYSLPLFDLMIQSECAAATLLPPRSVLVVAALHCCFFILIFFFFPRTPELQQIVNVQGYDALLRPITTQLIVAIALFLWVRSNQKFRLKLMQAETIADVQQAALTQNVHALAPMVAEMQATSNAVTALVHHLSSPEIPWSTTGTVVDRLAAWIHTQQTVPDPIQMLPPPGTPDREAALVGQLADILLGMCKTQSVCAAAHYRIADLLHDHPKNIDELARESGTNAHALHRLLRALASLGIFEQRAEDIYAQSELSDLLRESHPNSLYPFALMHGDAWFWQMFQQMHYSLETEQPAVVQVFGKALWSYFQQDAQDAGVRFFQAHEALACQVDTAVATIYDFAPFETIIDVGGGTGSMLAAILAHVPHLHGVLFEQESVLHLPSTENHLKRYQDRCRAWSGDFFDRGSFPAEKNKTCYTLRQILQDWREEQAITILRNCVQTAKQVGQDEGILRILIIESLIPPLDGSLQKFVDLHLLVAQPGGERTEQEYREIVAHAGLQVTRVIPLPPTAYSILETEVAR